MYIYLTVNSNNFHADSFLSFPLRAAQRRFLLLSMQDKYRCNTCHKNTVQGLTINAAVLTEIIEACCLWLHSLRIKSFLWELNKHWVSLTACNASKWKKTPHKFCICSVSKISSKLWDCLAMGIKIMFRSIFSYSLVLPLKTTAVFLSPFVSTGLSPSSQRVLVW